ncbi:MAG: putative rane protein, partial [Pseudonocardiales bacterium]|nr:putative rane protein [Pseudonocardiales bacterium]
MGSGLDPAFAHTPGESRANCTRWVLMINPTSRSTDSTTAAGTTSRPRSMFSYLALPRPGDLGKAIILPVGFGVGSLITSAPTRHELLSLLVVWFAVEYLAYQARYQWNDIRGFWADQLHPDCD